jgi:hypothetical protein
MPEENKQVEMQFNYQVDQQVSVNAYFDTEISGETVRFQITSRYNSTPEKIVKTVNTAIAAFEMLRQEHPRQMIQPQSPKEPRYESVDDGGEKLPEVQSFTASKLSVSVTDGKISFKVMGGQFEKWGVTVYDEVMKAAGLSYDPNKPDNIPNISGWRVDWIEYQAKNGKMYKKVTRLLPSKSDF